VSVYPDPPDPVIAECIDRAVRGLAWPSSEMEDFFTTSY
jgi:hypothetical protein